MMECAKMESNSTIKTIIRKSKTISFEILRYEKYFSVNYTEYFDPVSFYRSSSKLMHYLIFMEGNKKMETFSFPESNKK